MTIRSMGAALALLALLGCGDDDDSNRKNRATPTDTASPTPTPSVTASATPTIEQNPALGGRFSLAFDGAAVLLRRGDEVLVRLPLDAFELGLVSFLEPIQSYDPYPMVAGINQIRTPTGLHFVAASSAEVVSASDDAFTLRLGFTESTSATLTVVLAADGRFDLHLQPQVDVLPVAFFRLGPRVDANEGFYGLGEYFDSVNHRGKLRAMQLEVDTSIESLYNEAHVPVPLVIGTRGWGLFVESPYPAVFDVAAADDDVIEATFGTGYGSDQGLRFHLFAADHPLDVTRHYYDLTGYPLLPAPWALGPLVWRDENRDQEQVENDLMTMRDLDLPTTGVWIDRPYARGVNSFDFNPTQFPEPQAMIDLAHDLGFRMALWHTPYVDRVDPDTADLRREATENGYYPPRSGVILNNFNSPPIDLTNPAAYAWWQDLIRRYTDMGIEGFKLDYGEDVVMGLPLGTRIPWMFHDGSDENTMHSRYQLFYHRVYAELLPQDGSFLLCRGGTYGSQQYASVIWPGDLDANLARHREVVGEGETAYVAVGGLPAAVIAGLNLGPSGFPFFGSDTGGYRHSPPDKETFTRWFEHTALSTVMQIGTSSNDVAWEPTPENGFDQEMLDWYRIYTRLHLRLFPYQWSYARRIAADGRPIQRALGLAYPQLGVHPDDIYMFGDDLLVAPVVERGARQREVILPPGRWFDWWTGEAHEGGRTITVDAPLGTLPLFLREGGIVPLLRPTIDAIAPTTDAERVDSYATTPGILYPRIAIGPDSEFVLFDGGEIEQAIDGASWSVRTRNGDEFRDGFVIEVIGLDVANPEVTLDGAPIAEIGEGERLEDVAAGWSRDADSGALHVRVADPAEHTVIVRP